MENFINILNENKNLLDKYIPVVVKVHGKHHPEFLEVENLYNQIILKLDSGNIDILQDLDKLNNLTDNYKIPNDVCETYEAVYKSLKKIDSSFRGI